MAVRKMVLLLSVFLSLSGVVFGQDVVGPKIMNIWNKDMPFPGTQESAPLPTFTYFPVLEGTPHPAVIICPGGGYRTLAMRREGFLIAQEFNRVGISAFVLRYRLGSEGYKHPAMISDLQQALAIVRENALIWHIDPDKIGVVGFSAGGHLAATATVYSEENYSTRLNLTGEKYSVRPNFAILAYPVITMDNKWTHFGTKFQLLGSNPSPELVRLLSCENYVTEKTPPVFLVHAEDDITVPIENSKIFYQRLQEKNVPSELYIYQSGRHGFGVKKREWFERCLEWLSEIGILENIQEKVDLNLL